MGCVVFAFAVIAQRIPHAENHAIQLQGMQDTLALRLLSIKRRWHKTMHFHFNGIAERVKCIFFPVYGVMALKEDQIEPCDWF